MFNHKTIRVLANQDLGEGKRVRVRESEAIKGKGEGIWVGSSEILHHSQ
ncbi:hypothetical protein QUB06_28990 [Microcoleus sp. D2_18a_D3]